MHEIPAVPELEPPVGFAHVVRAAPGPLVFLGGQVGHDETGTVVSDDLVAQFDRALANLVVALHAAGARPTDLVWMQVFTGDMAEYRAALGPLGRVYRAHLGHHYPAMALLEVSGFFDPAVKVEVTALAVVGGAPASEPGPHLGE